MNSFSNKIIPNNTEKISKLEYKAPALYPFLYILQLGSFNSQALRAMHSQVQFSDSCEHELQLVRPKLRDVVLTQSV